MLQMLRNIPLFSGLNDVQLERVANACMKKNYATGTTLFHENEPGSIFYIVLAGAVKIFMSNAGGEEKILSIFTAGESFGELALLDGKPRSATAQAIEPLTVLALSKVQFHQLLKEHFDINLEVIKQLSSRLRDMNEQVHDLTYMDARRRVIKSLAKLAASYGSRTGTVITIRINLNYNEVSQLAGVPRHLLFKVFEDLQAKKLLQIADNEFRIDTRHLLLKE